MIFLTVITLPFACKSSKGNKTYDRLWCTHISVSKWTKSAAIICMENMGMCVISRLHLNTATAIKTWRSPERYYTRAHRSFHRSNGSLSQRAVLHAELQHCPRRAPSRINARAAHTFCLVRHNFLWS